MECKVAVHPCELLLICPAEASHAPILNRSTAIITLVYPAPDGVLGLVGEIPGAVVARLVATVARADVLLYDVSDAARAGGASTGIFLVTDADIIALLPAPAADVWQNDSVYVALGTPAIGRGLGDARVPVGGHTGLTIVRPENRNSLLAAAEASHGRRCALVAHGSSHCRIPAISSDAEEEVRVGDGHLVVMRSV